MRMMWLVSMSVIAQLCGIEARAEETASVIRARLLATRLETDITVELRNGQKWKGTLTDITENNFLLLAEPDKETRKRLRLSSGMKLKKNLAFDDVVTLEGGAGADLVEKYLILGADDAPGMQARLAAAAAAGFRVRASAGVRVVLLEKVDSGGPFEYVVSGLGEKREKELDEWGAQGFRVVPGTIGSWVGTPSAVLERAPNEAAPRDYRVLETAREGTTQKEFLESAARGYRVIGLTRPGQRLILLESRVLSAPTVPVDYRLVSDLDSASLSRQTEDGYRLAACSDGERLCIFEKTASGQEFYTLLATGQLSTLEKELNAGGGRGYRFHPGTLGRDMETFAVMEDTHSSCAFEYRVISRHRAHEIQEVVAPLAREGFEVAAITSDTKALPGSGGLKGLGDAEAMADVIVVMERATSK